MTRRSGLYLVKPLCLAPWPVNANDPRHASTCLRVSRGDMKIGKAMSFEARERQYHAVFGPGQVQFLPVAWLDDARSAERAVLKALRPWRLRGPSGHLTEWLRGLAEDEALQRVRSELDGLDRPYEWAYSPSAR